MASDAQLRSWYAIYRCNTSNYQRVAFPGPAETWHLYVARPAVEAFEAFAGVMADNGYLFRESAGGTYNCRKIAGSEQWSIHSYGLAIDLNPSKNPHRSPLQHDYPQAFLDGIAAIQTGNGKPAFKWGGEWSTPDAMHFQIDVSPADLATGITTPQPPLEENMMLPIGPGSPTEDIRSIQGLLNTAFNAGLTENGSWDTATKNAAAAHLGASTGDPGGKAGSYVNARMYRALLVGLIQSVGGSGTIDQAARDAAAEANQTLSRVKSVL
jgi:hypothetical protein